MMQSPTNRSRPFSPLSVMATIALIVCGSVTLGFFARNAVKITSTEIDSTTNRAPSLSPGGLPSNIFTASSSMKATHTQTSVIKPAEKGKTVTLQTFTLGPEGELWMACREKSGLFTGETGALMVYRPDGSLRKAYPLSFIPQAINFSPSRKLFVAGSGKIARISLDGKEEIVIDAPNIGDRSQAVEDARKADDANQLRIKQALEKQTASLRDQLAKYQTAPANETAAEKQLRERRLKILEAQLKVNSVPVVARPSANDQLLKRMLRSTAIAATEKDVFVACPESTGYGYGVWRLNADLVVDKKVVDGGRGCCGQFDIQTDGEHLVLAENTKFQVGVYDRDGKRLSGFGKKSTSAQDGFGSCCNPMNIRCLDDGTILTAESSIGHIKRFSRDGKLLTFIGTAKVAGGCKHVAIGFDPERDHYYLMHEDLSHVAVLSPNGASVDANMKVAAIQSRGE